MFTSRNYRLKTIDDLGAEAAAGWNRFRVKDPNLRSPFFDAGFLAAVLAVRDDVEICEIRLDQKVVGLLPFQRLSASRGQPLGGRMNDCHGFLLDHESGIDWGQQLQPRQVLKACGLRKFQFHGLVNSQFASYSHQQINCPLIRLDTADYFQSLAARGKMLKKQGQKTRALERTHGRLQFEWDCRDPNRLEQVLAFKRQRIQKQGTFDLFQIEWTRQLIQKLFEMGTDPPVFGGDDQAMGKFRSLLSVMTFDGQLVAGHFGIANRDTLHCWFPTFNPAFARYSPGTELILQIARRARQDGIRLIDFGYGDQPFKCRFANSTGQVGVGCFNGSATGRVISSSLHWAKNQVRQMPFKSSARSLVNFVCPRFGSHRYR